MTLPFLLSVPHAGIAVPPEVEDFCILSTKDFIKDSDEGAAEIYLPLRTEVAKLVTTDTARAIVDMNRAEDDRRKDGVVKTHTCWDVPIYREPLPDDVVEELLEQYYRPYHMRLTRYASDVVAGIDCHTMAAVGPPVGPDPGKERPSVCLSNADGTCPGEWLVALAEVLGSGIGRFISINNPFKGGFITRNHAKEIPWLQLEMSRAPFLSNEEKSERVLAALKQWLKRIR